MSQPKEKVLIVNLLRNGDIFTTAHLIHSMKAQNPNQEISLLVWEEFKVAAGCLKDVSNIYTINRKKILTYKKNDIYSDAFALETFYKNLETPLSIAWNKVINYSNDKFSANITSFLSNDHTKKIGMTINNRLSAVPSSAWDIVFNDLLTTLDATPMHFTDCYHQMTRVEKISVGEKIKIDSKYNEIAFKNINSIRDQSKSDEEQVFIIGIQLFTSDESKNIPKKELIKVIDLLASSKNYCPILLIAPTQRERAYSNEINNEFNNEIVSVEADFLAVPSLLMNIDLLLTPDTVIKHIADLVDTPVVEVSLGKSPFLKQGTLGVYNLILTNNISKRDFKSSDKNHIKALDMFSAISVILENRNLAEFKISDGVTIYQPTGDHLGIKYRYLAGDCPTQEEISRIMSRVLLSKIYDGEVSNKDYEDIMFFDQSEIKKWIEKQKLALGSTVKDVLGTLRALHMAKENRNKATEFITALDRLLTHCHDQTLVSIPCILFRAKVEAINNTSFQENSKLIEALLFVIKDEIQIAYSCIKNLDQLSHKQTNIGMTQRL